MIHSNYYIAGRPIYISPTIRVFAYKYMETSSKVGSKTVKVKYFNGYTNSLAPNQVLIHKDGFIMCEATYKKLQVQQVQAYRGSIF